MRIGAGMLAAAMLAGPAVALDTPPARDKADMHCPMMKDSGTGSDDLSAMAQEMDRMMADMVAMRDRMAEMRRRMDEMGHRKDGPPPDGDHSEHH